MLISDFEDYVTNFVDNVTDIVMKRWEDVINSYTYCLECLEWRNELEICKKNHPYSTDLQWIRKALSFLPPFNFIWLAICHPCWYSLLVYCLRESEKYYINCGFHQSYVHLCKEHIPERTTQGFVNVELYMKE